MEAGKPPFPVYTTHGLSGGWSAAQSVPWATAPSRLEGEVANLPVYGSIPQEIDGTFYRIMVDPFFPQQPENAIPIEGDGNVSAFRIRNGQVDMKTKYVDTEHLRLERRANKRLFGLYRNPYTHHPHMRSVGHL
ncbi:retinal pigment epithelial membrane protein-domain-containing protein [Aspergillus candidus]|uniref:Retinal pigment epithelial membrane protein-domain-containing protein n=1 Tax=Aspergillus candidus TaxID=41067 RepID=A0A2I2F0Q3_ASPCN|nr:retinal pigment epithelial membrane protein-domain-containing protein [Aspergillus candidus]PLB34212.1 retinal pigment epithelial membrane protein-domain-containing protein [Aspergillus candidus]